MKKQTFVIIFFILIFVFVIFFLDKNTYNVIEVTENCGLVVDLNKNHRQNDNEIFELKDVIPYCTVENIKSDKNLPQNFTQNEYTHLAVSTKEFFRKIFLNSVITFDKDGEILVNFSRPQILLLNNGFAYTDAEYLKGEANPEKTIKILNDGKQQKYYYFNKISRKYHNFDCPAVKKSKKIEILSEKELPQNAKPCKYCLMKEETKQEQKKAKQNKISDEHISLNNIQVYHTFGAGTLLPSSKCDNVMCQALLKEIENTENSIDIAAYELFGIPPIVNAIKSARQKGVKIRFVTDNSTLTKTFQDITPDELAEKMTDDGTSKDSHRLMHNKFFIFDDKKVWTGSANITSTSISGFSANTSILIDSEEIAQIFKKEFENFINGKFHSAKEKVFGSDSSGKIRVFFSPKNNTINEEILEEIRNAKKKIYVASYIITHKNLTDELLSAHSRGVEVKIITDANSARNNYSTHKTMRGAKIPVKTENFAGTMHMKNIIIDGETVVTGSMNLTKSGEKYNDENTLIIKDKNIAANFEKVFNKIWELIPDKYLKYDPNPESKESVGSCFDGVDNNFNGILDGLENACKSR